MHLDLHAGDGAGEGIDGVGVLPLGGEGGIAHDDMPTGPGRILA